MGLNVEQQKEIPVIYKGKVINAAFRADLVINNKLLIELKSVTELNDVHMAQTITYLKLSKLKLGLLINFNVSFFKNSY